MSHHAQKRRGDAPQAAAIEATEDAAATPNPPQAPAPSPRAAPPTSPTTTPVSIAPSSRPQTPSSARNPRHTHTPPCASPPHSPLFFFCAAPMSATTTSTTTTAQRGPPRPQQTVAEPRPPHTQNHRESPPPPPMLRVLPPADLPRPRPRYAPIPSPAASFSFSSASSTPPASPLPGFAPPPPPPPPPQTASATPSTAVGARRIAISAAAVVAVAAATAGSAPRSMLAPRAQSDWGSTLGQPDSPASAEAHGVSAAGTSPSVGPSRPITTTLPLSERTPDRQAAAIEQGGSLGMSRRFGSSAMMHRSWEDAAGAAASAYLGPHSHAGRRTTSFRDYNNSHSASIGTSPGTSAPAFDSIHLKLKGASPWGGVARSTRRRDLWANLFGSPNIKTAAATAAGYSEPYVHASDTTKRAQGTLFFEDPFRKLFGKPSRKVDAL